MTKRHSSLLALLFLFAAGAALAEEETTVYYGQSVKGTAALTRFRDEKGEQRLKLFIDLPDKSLRVNAGMGGAMPRASGDWLPLSGGGFAYVRIQSETAEYVVYAGIGTFEEGNTEPVSISGVVIKTHEGTRNLDLSRDCMSALGGNLFESMGLPKDEQGFAPPVGREQDETVGALSVPDGTKPVKTTSPPPEAKPEWRDMVITFLNPTLHEIVAVTYGVEMDNGLEIGWERTNTLPWRAADIMLNHIRSLSYLELDLGTTRVLFDDLDPLGDRADPVLMLRKDEGVFSLRLENPEVENAVILSGRIENLLDETMRGRAAFADVLKAESIADLRRAADNDIDEDEVQMLTMNVRLGGDPWIGVAIPAAEGGDYDPETTAVGEVSFRTAYSRERLERAVDAMLSEGYRPWMLIRFETDDPYEDMEATNMVDFAQLPGKTPEEIKEALLVGLTFERPPNQAIEAEAMLLSPGLYAEALEGKDFSSGPGFTLRVGSSNLLEIIYFPDCSESAELMQGGILP